MGERAADIACADERDLLACHMWGSPSVWFQELPSRLDAFGILRNHRKRNIFATFSQ
jgi:hypothetical protein